MGGVRGGTPPCAQEELAVVRTPQGTSNGRMIGEMLLDIRIIIMHGFRSFGGCAPSLSCSTLSYPIAVKALYSCASCTSACTYSTFHVKLCKCCRAYRW